MVKEYEENIIQPPLEFRDDYKPVPKPRTKTTTKKTGFISTDSNNVSPKSIEE